MKEGTFEVIWIKWQENHLLIPFLKIQNRGSIQILDKIKITTTYCDTDIEIWRTSGNIYKTIKVRV